MAQVTLGNFSTVNGRPVLFGSGGSGLDTASLINALLQSKASQVVPLQDQITQNARIGGTLNQFNTLLSKFQTAADALRKQPGIGHEEDNAFDFATASVVSSTSIAASTYLAAIASPGARAGTYTINSVNALATATKQTSHIISAVSTSAAIVSDTPTGTQIKAGTITYKGKNITLTAGMSLDQVVSAFNAVSADTKIAATVIKTGTDQYQLSFTATKTGLASGFDMNDTGPGGTFTDASGVILSLSSSNLVPFQMNNISGAADASVTIDGAVITSATNSISGAIPGMTFNLVSITPPVPPNTATTLTVTVKPDQSTIQSSVVNFINAYNQLKAFEGLQTQTNSDGTYASTALLANNSSFHSIMNNITNTVASLVNGLSSGTEAHPLPTSIGDVLGIGFIDQEATTDASGNTLPKIRNLLNMNPAVFGAGLEADFDAFRAVFEYTFSSSNPNLAIFSRTNADNVTSATLNINPFAKQVTTAVTVADADTAVVSATPTGGGFKPGDIVVNGQTITLTDGMTLNQIAAAFTAVAGTSGLAAAVVQDSPGVFHLEFTGDPAIANNFYDLTSTTVDATGIFTTGALDSGGKPISRITATGTYTATYNDGSGDVTVDLTGNILSSRTALSLTGPDGSKLSGLQFVYGSLSAVSGVTITLTQGLADKLFNIAKAATNVASGDITIGLGALNKNTDDLNARIAKINTETDQLRDQLVIKFGALERAISLVNTLLSSLDAQAAAAANARSR